MADKLHDLRDETRILSQLASSKMYPKSIWSYTFGMSHERTNSHAFLPRLIRTKTQPPVSTIDDGGGSLLGGEEELWEARWESSGRIASQDRWR